jgi:hypothetical protein
MSTFTVTGDIAAKCLSISRRQHTSLVADGTLPPPTTRGKYDLAATVQAFIAHKTKSAPSQLNVAKVKKTQAEAQLLHDKAQRQAGALISAEQVAQAHLEIIGGLHAALIGMCYRVCVSIPDTSTHELRLHALIEDSRVCWNVAGALMQNLHTLPQVLPDIMEIPGNPNAWQGANYPEILAGYHARLFDDPSKTFDEIREQHQRNMVEGWAAYAERCKKAGVKGP